MKWYRIVDTRTHTTLFEKRPKFVPPIAENRVLVVHGLVSVRYVGNGERVVGRP